MKRIWKPLALSLLSLTLLFTAACGQQPEPETDSATDTAPVQEEVQDTQSTASTGEGKVLVVYFSASGSTEAVADTIADTLNADLFPLTPEQPYTPEDLDWTADGSRVNQEHDDESLRDIPLTSTEVENWDSYDTVFIGYPIWWGIAAWPTDTFVKANDFTGKTVIPFCTSSSSGLGQSGTLLADLAGTGEWLAGERFPSSVDSNTVADWASSVMQ